MRAWITTYLWEAKPSKRGETFLFYDADNDALVSFANWRHRDVKMPYGPDVAISIEWLGIAVGYQGEKTTDGPSICRRLIETVEQRARSHERSTPDTPLYLEVDARNEHAENVYRHFGFQLLDSVEVNLRGRYRRMALAPVGPTSQGDD